MASLISWKMNKKEYRMSLAVVVTSTWIHYLTHCRLNRLSHTIYWKSPISILGTSSYEFYIFLEKNENSGDPDQMPHSTASDLGLHCFPITLLWVCHLQWVTVIRVCQQCFEQVGFEIWDIGHFSPSYASYNMSPTKQKSSLWHIQPTYT